MTIFDALTRRIERVGIHPTQKVSVDPPVTPRNDTDADINLAWKVSTPGLATVALLTAFSNILKLAAPLYIFQVLDRVLSSRSLDTLVLLTVITVLAIIAASAAEITRRKLLSEWGVWIERVFGKKLFTASIETSKQSRTASALNDLSFVRRFVSSSAATAWLDVVFAPFFVFIVYLIHPLLALVVIAGIASMLVLGGLNEAVTRRSRAAAGKAKKQSDALVFAAERDREAVRTLSLGNKLAERWQETSYERLERNFNIKFLGFAISDIMRLVETFQRIACYFVGVWLVLAGSLTVGGVIAGAILGRIGTSLVRRAMASYRRLSLVRTAYNRLKRRLNNASHTNKAVRDLGRDLELTLHDVSFRYSKKAPAVIDNVRFSVKPGTSICIRGRSGSGKSTLVRLIVGALSPTDGRVFLGELPIERYTAPETAELVGYAQQEIRLFPGTIRDNISSMQDGPAEAIVEAAKLAGIHSVIMALPNGYETELQTNNTSLSVGERRRLVMARAFYGRPHLIVLDEPETNLDKSARQQLQRALDAAKSWGAIVVVTTMSMEFTRPSDQVLVLHKNSKAVLHDTVEDYLRTKAQVEMETQATQAAAG